MYYMFDENLKIAYETSNEITGALSCKEDQMISTQEVIHLIREKYCSDISVIFTSFSKANIGQPYGAMMKTELDNENIEPLKAHIIVNSDNDASFQRFSLLHELGHLVTHAWKKADEIKEKERNKYVVSTHIDYKITSIGKEDYDSSLYLKNEQIANIFALRVLMPSEQFYKKIEKYNNVSDVANFFGVPEDAVISRMMIGA